MASPPLQIGLVDFAEPALLMVGDAQSFRWLASQIGSRQQIDFDDVSYKVRQVGVRVRLTPTANSGCLRRHAETIDWEVSATEARQFAEQLQALAAAESPAHAYLDPESNLAGFQVIASKDEYVPDRTLSEHST